LTAVRARADDRGVVVPARPLRTAVLLTATALVAWIVTVGRMRGMDAGPGTDLGGLGWFLGIWLTMTAAMMLPSSALMVLAYVKASPTARAGSFVLGYLGAWTAYGLAAYALYRLVERAGLGWLDWQRGGSYVAGAAIAAAGLYQLSPLKQACLRHCRGPLRYIVHGWREGRSGAVRMGLEHGLFCVGCCWGLMLALFALGVMSLFWTALVAAAIFAEKVLPRGERLAGALALVLVALGLLVAFVPADVPGLSEPAPMGMTP